MIGAVALVSTLVDSGVEVCFMNPGTSEMHFVQSLDAVPAMRGVLTLFEGVATGAADGYARLAGRPAAVLLHLGPGLGNGLANLHNARRAHSPLVCVVGAQATYHARFDPPLQSDIETVAHNVAGWVETSGHEREVGSDAARAVAAAHEHGGQVAVLVLPADVSWNDGGVPAAPVEVPDASAVDPAAVAAAAERITGASCVLLLGGRALSERGLRAASRIAAATGARLLVECFPARLERGAGLPDVERVAYLAERVAPQLAGATDLVLLGAPPPAAFFAYPGRPDDLVPDGCTVHPLAAPGQDVEAVLDELADRLASGVEPVVTAPATPPAPTGALTPQTLADAVALTLPENAVLVDEAITAGGRLPASTAGAARHTLLTLTGGAIGQGLPAATGAAVAAPHRPVVCVQADGSAMYTVQALWTQAREQLDVTTVLVNNASYAILRAELDRVGAEGPRERAQAMLSLADPELDFVALATGTGVPAVRVETAEDLVRELRRAVTEPGPHLVEVMMRG
ncbi:acetolactate synthase large subunit [Jatrophihabitans endophyticus]|uniref:acetolactate synthase large subunit n=1 Tax=Jatrophihabitans endophyticus TaxID=1206085 RepID=UPI001A049FEB|nr:acetolactate synthase large subunit [Jatrophihabitans endophyticus]MBE7187320.1 acetolactate synthase large subunit [Jatrophihabitans endophyticus]